MDMHHIVSSESTAKCCEKGRAYRRKSLFLNGRNNLLTDTIIFNCLVILCTAYMVTCSIVASYLTTILCHPGAQFLYDDLYPAFTRKTFLSENRKSDFFFHYFSPTVIPYFLFCPSRKQGPCVQITLRTGACFI